jgi:hypothetical protein
MKLPSLVAVIVAGGLPLMAGQATAAPLAQPQTGSSLVQPVQYWGGPPVIVVPAPSYGYGQYRRGYRHCYGDSGSISGYPSWACSNRRATEW